MISESEILSSLWDYAPIVVVLIYVLLNSEITIRFPARRGNSNDRTSR